MSVSAFIFRFLRAFSLVTLAAIICCLSDATAFGQVTLIDDQFNDGGFTNGADLLDAEWYGYRASFDNDASGPFAIQIDDESPGIGGGNAFLIDRNGTSVTGAIADLPGATGGAGNQGTGNNGNGLAVPNLTWKLVGAGDFIKLEFDYRMLGTPPNSNRGFRFGFGNRMGTGDTATNLDNFDDNAFWVESGTGSDLTLKLKQEFGGSNEVFNGSDSNTGGTTAKTNLENDDSVTSASLILTKLVDGNIQVNANLGGDATSTIFGSAASCNAGACVDTVDSFDFIGIVGAKGSGHDYIVDNVLVTAQATQVSANPSLLADFDGDGDVDGADFLDWQRGSGLLYNDTNLADWESEYGSPVAVAAVSAVPEPLSLQLYGLGTLGLLILCRRRVVWHEK